MKNFVKGMKPVVAFCFSMLMLMIQQSNNPQIRDPTLSISKLMVIMDTVSLSGEPEVGIQGGSNQAASNQPSSTDPGSEESTRPTGQIAVAAIIAVAIWSAICETASCLISILLSVLGFGVEKFLFAKRFGRLNWFTDVTQQATEKLTLPRDACARKLERRRIRNRRKRRLKKRLNGKRE